MHDITATAPAVLPIQPAKSPTAGLQFLQIVAKPRAKREPKLTRVAFKVSRLMEFCSERELQNQTGHSIGEWPLLDATQLDHVREKKRKDRAKAGNFVDDDGGAL
jgi:hypothetical protein